MEQKCVMVIDEALPLGIIANTAGILGATIGKIVPELIGEDVVDQSQQIHEGIVTIPIPILKGNRAIIQGLRTTLYQETYCSLRTVDFSDLAQRCKHYGEYIEKMGMTEENKLHYFGIAIYGDKKLVNALTGSMPLLR